MDGIKYRDLQVVNSLMQHGADLSAPRELVFYLYFPDAESAERAAPALSAAGLEVALPGPNEEYLAEHPKAPRQWPVIATSTDRAVIPDFLRETVDLCAVVAREHGGDYDGWEAGVNADEVGGP